MVAHIRDRLPREAAGLYEATFPSLEGGLKPHGIPPEHVARAVEHALTAPHPRTCYVVGVDAALTRLVARLPDAVRDAFFKIRLQRGR